MNTPKKGGLTKGAKIVLGLIVIAVLFIALNRFLPEAKIWQSMVPKKANLAEVEDLASNNVNVPLLPFPSGAPVKKGVPIRFNHWAWNSQAGLMLANGGTQTTEGSIMAKHGVNLILSRQDDVSQMQANLLAFANELEGGNPQPNSGVHFVAIMGDGAPAFLAGINSQLAKLGADYTAEVVGSCGYSRGEDKFMGPMEWKTNPQTAKGSLIAGVLRDGDWNIALKWAGDNGIPNNPDETTWDENALNWVNAASYLDAPQKYITGYSEDRAVIKDGKKTGEKRRVTVNGCVTWTPGDVNVAKNKGGLVSIVSTLEYRWQMPNTIIGIKKWNRENRELVEGMLAAIFEAGDQIKNHDAALRKAASISAQVYAEENPDYWYKYFHIVTENDITGLKVELGGSAVNNAADNMYLFGLLPGSMNIFAATYTTFGDIAVQQYPDLVPSYPAVKEILNTSFVSSVYNKSSAGTQAEVPVYSASTQLTQQVSKKSWQINFNTGSATFTPAAKRTLEELINSLAISGLLVEIHGHTDDVGDLEANQTLSEQRAFAVKEWLETKSPANFSKGRIRVRAFGESQPEVPNNSEANRARNRRVEIIQGQ